MKAVYFYDWLRSARARARPDGGLHDLAPHELLNQLYAALVARAGLDPATVGDVVLGCVTQHGEQAGNIAKTSALYAGWPASVSGITVNRFCSSGLDAINIAALKIAAGQDHTAVAGGIEMMSRVPMLADRAAVFSDQELARRCRMLMMGSGADLIATLSAASRAEIDGVALQSQQRAARARDNGWFRSIVPIVNPLKGITVETDECIRAQTTAESLARMEPAFAALGAGGADAEQLRAFAGLVVIDHLHTAGNSPAMADAAALLLLGDESTGARLGKAPRARLLAAANACDDPLLVVSGCVAATAKLMRTQGLCSADIDLFELHEAFAATVIKARRDLDIPDEKLNVNGGVIALGHPLGATGAIMAGTLLDEMERRDLKRGIVAASGAAGTGAALLLERV
ncbi:MAG: acetyl-CoA C-acyltransferase [Gammaproteobacteria bacterium]|nr:acetyl-CoA C-acyltransferase [Gammaproteobacteria bacterium]MBK7727535.1 acetyl-CoA C-acyltransferase [Gammaproteobacteria bacterium]